MPKLSRKQARYARTMKSKGMGAEAIIDFFGGKFTQADINEGIVELRAVGRSYYQREYKAGGGRIGIIPTELKLEVPEAAIAQREHRRQLLPKSLTAWVCGDPLPGESALEKRAV